MDITKEELTRAPLTPITKPQEPVKIVKELASISLNADNTVNINISREHFSEIISAYLTATEDSASDSKKLEPIPFCIMNYADSCKLKDLPRLVCRLEHIPPVQCSRLQDLVATCALHGILDPHRLKDVYDKGLLLEKYFTTAQIALIKEVRS
jgi:hypothetical protein